MTTYWVVRHVPTGGHLPVAKMGSTSVKPTLVEPPRLFATQRGAMIALGHWLKGVVRQNGGYVPQADRKADDMAVVEVDLLDANRW